MAFECLVTSDWHIGSLTNIFENVLSKQIDEIHKIYNYAFDHGIKHIFIPGDISDKTVLSTAELMELIRFFSYYDGKINSYYISGNHDYHSSNRSSVDLLKYLTREKLFKTLVIFDEPTHLKIDGIPINFLPFPHKKLPSDKTGCINFVHMDTAGAVGDNGYAIRVKSDVDFGTDNVTISGHVHKYQTIKSKRWVYCGSPYQKTFGEDLPKGFIHCKASHKDDAIKFSHTFVDNKPDIILKTVKIKSVKDLSSLKKSSNIAYKLEPAEGVILPSDVMEKYNVSTIKNQFNIDVLDVKRDSNLLTGLVKYLQRSDLTDVQIKQAISEVKAAKEQYSLR